MNEHVVASEDDIKPGERLIIEVDGQEIGIFHHDDEYHAYRNWCPHQGGPLCEGSLTGTQESSFDRRNLQLETKQTREDEVLNCPWHGWEFDINTGKCLSRGKIQLMSYPVTVENGKIIIRM